MILLAVGHTPFDRLVERFDQWCSADELDGFAQIGPGSYTPRCARFARVLPNLEFTNLVLQSELVICHAGAGIVGELLDLKRNFLIVPRGAKDIDGRYQNPQQGYAKMLLADYGLPVCFNAEDLVEQAKSSRRTPLSYDKLNIGRSDAPAIISEFLKRRR